MSESTLPSAPRDLPASWIVASAWGVVALALLGVAVTFVWTAALSLAHPLGLDYGEGPLLDQTLRLARGESLYAGDWSDLPLVVSNYPPLFPLAQVPFARAFGPALWYGRLISQVSGLGAALAVYLVVRALTGHGRAAIVAGLSALGHPYLLYWAQLGRVDTLGLALALLAVWLCIRFPESMWGVLAAALLTAAAAHARQTFLLAAPLAITARLVFSGHRRAALIYCGVTALAVASTAACLQIASDGGYLRHVILANMNLLDPSRLGRIWGMTLESTPMFAVAFATMLVGGLRTGATPDRRAVAVYGLGALLVSATAAKAGSNVNYLLEWAAAASIGMGLFLAAASARPKVLVVALLLCAAQLGAVAASGGGMIALERAADRRPAEERLAALVAQSPGPVLAEEWLELEPLSGRRLSVQPFEMMHLARSGLWDESILVRLVERHAFALVLLRAQPADAGHFSARVRAAILRHYLPAERLSVASAEHALVLRPR